MNVRWFGSFVRIEMEPTDNLIFLELSHRLEHEAKQMYVNDYLTNGHSSFVDWNTMILSRVPSFPKILEFLKIGRKLTNQANG